MLYQDVTLGDRVIIHSGAVIGADGFGYRFTEGRFVKIPQLGSVEIHADAEIGACTTIDRGAIGPTIVGAGTKLDNLVMIAHNCELGRHNVFASQVGLAGSCTTGDYVRLAGQVGIKDHVRLNSGCMVGAKGGVHRDIPEGEIWIGYPATPEAEQKRLVFSLKRVPEMRDRVRVMEKQIALLTKQLEELRLEAKNSASPGRLKITNTLGPTPSGLLECSGRIGTMKLSPERDLEMDETEFNTIKLPSRRVGLLAGAGRFPIAFAEARHVRGITYTAWVSPAWRPKMNCDRCVTRTPKLHWPVLAGRFACLSGQKSTAL